VSTNILKPTREQWMKTPTLKVLLKLRCVFAALIRILLSVKNF
jgi:hypothetical protein